MRSSRCSRRSRWWGDADGVDRIADRRHVCTSARAHALTAREHANTRTRERTRATSPLVAIAIGANRIDVHAPAPRPTSAPREREGARCAEPHPTYRSVRRAARGARADRHAEIFLETADLVRTQRAARAMHRRSRRARPPPRARTGACIVVRRSTCTPDDGALRSRFVPAPRLDGRRAGAQPRARISVGR